MCIIQYTYSIPTYPLKGKPKLSRKMSRSLPSKGESKSCMGKEASTTPKKEDASSSSVDPSSSTGNTNSSNAPSSDGSLLKQHWPSQVQVGAFSSLLLSSYFFAIIPPPPPAYWSGWSAPSYLLRMLIFDILY